MTHVVYGFPSVAETLTIVEAMVKGGASMVEVQIPFSDPMADGPTIMHANEIALENGVTPKSCFKGIKELCTRVDIPVLVMTYFNIAFAYRDKASSGLEAFFREAKSAGVAGFIIPDVPPEETTEGFWSLAREYQMPIIPLVSPLSSVERLKTIAAASDGGFVYCVSTTGTTGARRSLPEDLTKYLNRVRKIFKRPLALGFGISQQTHVRALRGKADIAIVGSAMIDLVERTPAKERAAAVRKFTEELLG